MRSLRLTIFLWVLLVSEAIVTLIELLRLYIAVRNTDFPSELGFLLFLSLALVAFGFFLIYKMFQMEAWARNLYIARVVFGLFSLIVSGNFVIAFISIVVHVFVFWKSWDEFS